MQSVNMFEAKSRLVESIESKQEDEIIIARLVPLEDKPNTSLRIGIAKDAFVVPDDIDESNDEVAALFMGEPMGNRY